MTAQAALPSNLTSDDIHHILEILDISLNSIILQALMHVRRSFPNPHIGRCLMLLAISMLYILATIQLGETWAFIHYAFIDEGQNCYMIFMGVDSHSPTRFHEQLATGIISCISIFIADSSLIWRCWTVYGNQWLIIVIPVICTILGTVFQGIQIYHDCIYHVNNIEDSTYSGTVPEWKILYLALTITTTFWSTTLILYRIIQVVARSGCGIGIYAYCGVINALVESAILYSTVSIIVLGLCWKVLDRQSSIVPSVDDLTSLESNLRTKPDSQHIDIVFVACNISSEDYVAILAAAMRGIAPTLLVGHVAAGHTQPDDYWQESSTSTVSSLYFSGSFLTLDEEDDMWSAEPDEMDHINPELESGFEFTEEEEESQETKSLNMV
ncbi:hypothetical protein EDD18DRAFT_1427185 [Armillaria luteobubalina]|uniref:Uncharacterized protein n=1 Tax=Armillaria luteobubalina TaxID=153913 RepID=A0AA39QHX1_9AGAR|nr:hypothetical protein EDD18DRAFT_1427185 [Armillaria luteobubalina]